MGSAYFSLSLLKNGSFIFFLLTVHQYILLNTVQCIPIILHVASFLIIAQAAYGQKKGDSVRPYIGPITDYEILQQWFLTASASGLAGCFCANNEYAPGADNLRSA